MSDDGQTLVPARRAGKPLRVLHVTESLGGGVTTAIQAYVRMTPECEHVIVANRESPYYRRNWLDDEVEFLPLPASGKLSQLAAVARAVRATRPDVVHAHSSWAGVFVRLLPFLRSCRIVYTPHCFAFERTDVGGVQRLLFQLAEAVLGVRTGYLLGNGRHEVALARQLRTVRRASSLLVTPWQAEAVPRDRRSTPRPRQSERPMVVATSGRAVSQKGVDFFLDVVRLWPETAGAHNVGAITWQWLGGGTPEAEQRLARAGVRVSGWLQQQEVVHRLRGVDVYLHTAEWEAGYPLALMEAAALDLPLVVRSIPALQDLPLPLARNPRMAAEQLVGLLDPRRRAEASARTRAVVQSWHDDHVEGELSGLYQEVAEHGLVGAGH